LNANSLSCFRVALLAGLVGFAHIEGQTAHAQPVALQTSTVDETMTVDALGDATIEIGFDLSAMQMKQLGQTLGQNKALLKRDIMKLLSQYETYDWDIKVDEMTRHVTMRCKARGAVPHKGDGRYALVLPKEFRGGEPHGTTIDFNFVQPLGPTAAGNFSMKLNLPPDAHDITSTLVGSGASAQRVVAYEVATPARGLGAVGFVLLFVGIGAAIVGAGLIVRALMRKPS